MALILILKKIATEIITAAIGNSQKKNNESKVSKVLFYETYRKYNDDRNVLKQVVKNAEKAGEDMNVLWSIYENAFGPKEYFDTYWGNTRFEENQPAYVTDEEWSDYLKKNPRASSPALPFVLTPAIAKQMDIQLVLAGREPKYMDILTGKQKNKPDQSEGDKRATQIITITTIAILFLYGYNRS